MERFKTYQKIDSLFMRDEKTHRFTDELAAPEFGLIKYWDIYEKINGTNIRICYSPKTETEEAFLFFGGRTNDAALDSHLAHFLKTRFLLPQFIEKFKDAPTILFGEGYGAKIQQGKHYSLDCDFILFDCLIGEWWLEEDNLADVAAYFDLKMPVKIKEHMTIFEIIEFVQSKPNSVLALEGTHTEYPMEGVVARTTPMLFTRRGSRVLFKLKGRDFK